MLLTNFEFVIIFLTAIVNLINYMHNKNHVPLCVFST
jgi:hypothetical protein